MQLKNISRVCAFHICLRAIRFILLIHIKRNVPRIKKLCALKKCSITKSFNAFIVNPTLRSLEATVLKFWNNYVPGKKNLILLDKGWNFLKCQRIGFMSPC